MSDQFWIILLNILGMTLFLAELVLLPGITIAAILSFCSLVASVALAFSSYGIGVGFIVLGIVVVEIIILLAIFLRPKTWKNVALNSELPESIDSPIENLVKLNSTAKAITRLAPMGKVVINGKFFEAKTIGHYIDEGSDVRVIGYDNQSIVVELLDKTTN